MIIVTGASRGLGKAITERLIEKDEKVCVVKNEGEWVQIFFGWVKSKQIKKL